jgi:2-C-methyl-D-erythritol 4-phosphate cytidylyltransferase
VYDDVPTPVGLVPVEGRGSLPFALLHGESLVAVASWALGDAGVRLGDFTDSWAELQSWGAAVVVHDPLCAGTPVAFLAEAVRVSVTTGALVVGVRPVTDTVASTDGDRLGATVDRDGLLAVTSPVVVPAAAVAALPALPSTDDLAELVVALRAVLGPEHQVTFLEAPPSGRRVSDESDLRLVEALGG